MRLNHKVAIVTGGAGTIGGEIVRVFAREGAHVVIADTRQEEGEQLVASIRAGGGQASFVAADVTSLVSTEAMVASAVGTFGHLDILVCCAYWQEMGNALELSEEGWYRSLDVSLKGVWLSARAAIPPMLDRGGGSMVLISSFQSIMPYPRRVAYAAAKGGIDALTRELGLDWAPQGIRVNAILPGRIANPAEWERENLSPSEDWILRSECYPVNRVGRAEDIAYAALYLASDEASFVNGVNLRVDGGVSIQSAEAIVVPGLRRGWRPGGPGDSLRPGGGAAVEK